ncbi:MAG: Ser-Thr-rich GPI-anchored membrane family protein [Candidatus Methanoperedens sp.]
MKRIEIRFGIAKKLFFMVLLISFIADGAEAGLSMKVTSPNGGETWIHATDHNIKWDKPICTSNVKLNLYKSETLFYKISSGTENDGEYDWIVPHDLPSGKDYRIKAECSNFIYSTKDYSDGFFSIFRDMDASIISVFPNTIVSGETAKVTVRVTVDEPDIWPPMALSGAHVTFKVDYGAITNGDTDANGNFIATYYAPTVTESTWNRIIADVSKDEYSSDRDEWGTWVKPRMVVNVSLYPDIVGSGGISQVAVLVTHAGKPVDKSYVYLSTWKGTFDKNTGYTDFNGYLRTKYYAPIVDNPTYYSISAIAFKTTQDPNDYPYGVGEDIITVGTTNPFEQQITTNIANQEYPAISGNRIVWGDNRNGNWDIYMYDLSNKIERQITSNLDQQVSPAIDGDRIVWRDYRNRNERSLSDIYMYDLSINTERRITTNTSNQYDPAISGNRIVWNEWRNGNWDIYMYDLSTNTERQITTNTSNQYNPAISGNRIVWVDNRNGNNNWDIYMYDLSTNTERQITTNNALQYNPAISGNRIVWVDNRNGDREIYMYDLSTNTESRITTDISDQDSPAIDGDRIVWVDFRNGNAEIYMYNLSTNTESRITRDIKFQEYPDIDGNRIVWEDGRNGNVDIFMYQ